MGRYISIGIITECSVDRSHFKNNLEEENKLLSALIEHFAPLDLFDLTKTEDELIFTLKRDAISKDWVNYVGDFYKYYYKTRMGESLLDRGKEYSPNSIMRNLSKIETPDGLIDYCDINESEFYDKISYTEYVDTGKEICHVNVNVVSLAMEGKVIVEWIGTLFTFITNLIQEKFSNHPLSRATTIFITE